MRNKIIKSIKSFIEGQGIDETEFFDVSFGYDNCSLSEWIQSEDLVSFEFDEEATRTESWLNTGIGVNLTGVGFIWVVFDFNTYLPDTIKTFADKVVELNKKAVEIRTMIETNGVTAKICEYCKKPYFPHENTTMREWQEQRYCRSICEANANTEVVNEA